MNCIDRKCNGDIVKNGLDRNLRQRFICKTCGKTFSLNTGESDKLKSQKRIVLHLLLAGCEIKDISEELDIEQTTLINWKQKYLGKEINPSKALLSIHTLLKIFRALEKRRVAKIVTPRSSNLFRK